MNPILYNYRRCPYAMRARMALHYAGIEYQKNDIDFKNKPVDMLRLSPKGTVPVLVVDGAMCLDESLEIMLWALSQNDFDDWLESKEEALNLILVNDTIFKPQLDRYKYPNRFAGEDCSKARDKAEMFIQQLDNKLTRNRALLSDRTSLADIAIFPFIRQFANVDTGWFRNLPYRNVQNWLYENVRSDFFLDIMRK